MHRVGREGQSSSSSPHRPRRLWTLLASAPTFTSGALLAAVAIAAPGRSNALEVFDADLSVPLPQLRPRLSTHRAPSRSRPHPHRVPEMQEHAGQPGADAVLCENRPQGVIRPWAAGFGNPVR